jgi:hypothetical protein
MSEISGDQNNHNDQKDYSDQRDHENQTQSVRLDKGRTSWSFQCFCCQMKFIPVWSKNGPRALDGPRTSRTSWSAEFKMAARLRIRLKDVTVLSIISKSQQRGLFWRAFSFTRYGLPFSQGSRSLGIELRLANRSEGPQLRFITVRWEQPCCGSRHRCSSPKNHEISQNMVLQEVTASLSCVLFLSFLFVFVLLNLSHFIWL